MKNGSMFGKLKQMYESEKYKDSKYLWICTPNGKYRYEIFSMQYAKVGSDVYTLFSAHDEQFEAYVKKMAKQSKVDMKALGLGKDDYVVTLSTCTSDESVRFVVQRAGSEHINKIRYAEVKECEWVEETCEICG